MTHPNDIFDPLAITFVDADESAAETLASWKAADRFGPMDKEAPMLSDLRYVGLWTDLFRIAAESSDGSAESLKQLMHNSLTVAFFASRLYERVRSELNGGDSDGGRPGSCVETPDDGRAAESYERV
ncbi:hypothetical protein [Eggerthella sinensis]|uniref:Uncharacterized protein n=1 Tax=Eggerthella sinensis TaxID=242230 RepID=A0A3N0ITG3_9ACTN|nr:hypothetical protein [Eggerthella sinensis]RDB63658.1 hypothetical protein C1876_16805 [Eggerthella sinensis]RNM40273.1 hypothetical protein DMP09_15070 [Eggerthella sinensis]